MKDVKNNTGLIPGERAKQIVAFIKDSVQNKKFAKVLEDWQFEIDPRLLELKGRVLPEQVIIFGKNFMVFLFLKFLIYFSKNLEKIMDNGQLEMYHFMNQLILKIG